MVSFRSEMVNVNGLDIHYFTGGRGEPLLIVHGGGEGATAWRKNIAVLSRNYTIYVPDLPGFGLSQSMESEYYFPIMVEFINNFVQAIGLKKFYLMGHSFGGGIAAHFTLKYPEKVQKLVLVSSLCMGNEIAWWVRLTANPVMCDALGQAVIAVFKGIKAVAKFFGPWELVEPVTRTSIRLGSTIATMTRQTVVLLGQLNQIMVPTLVMWGAKDPIVPFKHAYAAAEIIPNCQVKVFENCGHSVYRDRLREFSNILSGFLG